MLSSESRGWNGVVVELHTFRDVDATIRHRDYVVATYVSGTIALLQQRYGKSVRRNVGPGDVIITPVGAPKRWQHDGEAVAIVIRIDPAFVRRVAINRFGIDPARFEIRDNFGTRDARIEQISLQMLANLGSEGVAGRMHAESLASELTAHLLGEYSTMNATAERPVARLSRVKLLRVIEYIDANLREDLKLRGIAETLAMSPDHFAHAFRQSAGLPPHRYVLERRVERAKRLLRETDLRITDIAHHIGCSSHSHFSVLFHRATGQTPRDYRKRV